MQVVREVFRETAAVRFEGNNYSDEWVKDAEKRGLPNFRRTPEALAQLVTPQSRDTFTRLGILANEELDSRYHVKLERYIQDMLIELHTVQQMVDTMVLPAAYSYLGTLSESAANAKTAGIAIVPQIAAANEVGKLVEALQKKRDSLAAVIEKADGMHESPEACAKLLTADGADRMADVRELTDKLELLVGDEFWPLPKYREMLFPV
jgi:glutamine synthetase